MKVKHQTTDPPAPNGSTNDSSHGDSANTGLYDVKKGRGRPKKNVRSSLSD